MTYMKNSRRDFLKGLTATSVLSDTSLPGIAATYAVKGSAETDVAEPDGKTTLGSKDFSIQHSF